MSAHPSPAAGARLLAYWQALSRWPGGRALFSRVVTWRVRYARSIRPVVTELRAGRCSVRMRDRAAVRNHLRSIHAAALTNLGETTGGLAMLTALPADVRGIAVGLSAHFEKKARGPLVAESECSPPRITEPTDFEVTTTIRDRDGDLVAETRTRWRLAPR